METSKIWLSENVMVDWTVSVPFKNFILTFMLLVEKGCQCRSINIYRSEISVYDPVIEGIPVDKCPQKEALMFDIFNRKPPLPIDSFTWQFQEAFKYIKTNWPISENLAMK